jgi:NTE family protein
MTPQMKIALALSGGGFRATVFHLGVLARLAEGDQLENVTFLSTVSGGSLCIGLVHAKNNLCWPTSKEYINHVLPEVRRLLTTFDLQKSLIFRVLGTFWTFLETRADDLSELMRKHWGITASLRDLPEHPRWMINATCYESGKNWRFERFRMGDYIMGYTYDTDLPLSDALAASAGFPGLIGPMVIEMDKYSWFKYRDSYEKELTLDSPETQVQKKTRPIQPEFSEAHLWDGGVYDNHGLEGLHDFDTGWRKNIEFLIVSDAAGRSKPEAYQRGPKALLRLATGIMMDQIRSLRTRAILERLISHEDKGVFLQTGNTCEHVFKSAGRNSDIPEFCSGCLSEEEVILAAEMETTIKRMADEEFERLFRHGFEVADYTLYAYYPEKFPYIGYLAA